MRHRQLFIARGLPVFQNKMFTDQASAIACPTGDIVLVQDMETGLIFNAAFDERLLQYDVDYQNEQAHSSYFQAHLANVGSIVDRHFSSKSLIEVGCGKGYFLEYLADAGYNITGIDPVYEGDNPNIIKAPFESKLGKSADGIILRHVLEHISDPLAFLEIVAEANGRQGLIYIEVPCFDWICENNAWFDIFYEHVNYFRLDDFQNIFGSIREIGRVFGGQYLYVVAELASLRKPSFDRAGPVIFPKDFLSGIDKIHSLAIQGQTTVWGAASKGVIFSILMTRAGIKIDQIIDINPAKQGKFLASSGLQVCSPEEGIRTLKYGDNVFIMNSNYLNEIVALTNNQFNYIRVEHHEF